MPIFRFVIAALAALISTTAWAQAPKHTAYEGSFLLQVCKPGQIRGGNCLEAKNYPVDPDGEPRACNVDITGSQPYSVRLGVYGRFITVVHYQSDCEPHATEYGGMLLFESGPGLPMTFRSYSQGSVFDKCVVLSAPRGQNDRLVCLTSSMHQGYLESTVSEITFRWKGVDDLEPIYRQVATATSNSGAYGVEMVSCKGPIPMFGFDNLRPGPSLRQVQVQVSTLTRSELNWACRHPRAALPADVGPDPNLPEGSAALPPQGGFKRDFLLDLDTGNFSSLSQ